MLRMSWLEKETFVAIGRKTGVRRIVILDPKNLENPHARYNFKTVEGEEVASLGSGIYLVLPTGEILNKTVST